MLHPFLTMVNAARTEVTMRRGSWSNTYPIDQMAHWLQFYRRLAIKRPKIYGDCVASIEAAIRTLYVDYGAPAKIIAYVTGRSIASVARVTKAHHAERRKLLDGVAETIRANLS